MLKLIRGELFRVLHKRSLYIYFSMVLIGYFIVTFVRSGGFDGESVVKDAINLFIAFPVLAGGFIFSAVYTDDLNSKNLTTLVGYGISKVKIIFAKFILILVITGVFFGLMPLFHCALYAVFDSAATVGQIAVIYAVSLKFLLMTLAYSSLSSIVVYGLQRHTFAVVTYLLLAFSVVGALITAISNMLELDLARFLVSGITDRILAGLIGGAPAVLPAAEYFLYIVFPVALSITVFYKKEMEF